MIEIKNLSKIYDNKVTALKNIDLTIEDGDIYGIIGMSGAGKSTFVRCINLLEKPTEGQITVNGKTMTDLSPKELNRARKEIAMIFQSFNLLKQRTCLKNICFPMELDKVPKQEAEERAKKLLELVGLSDKARCYPAQLSGGQQQRIAIARALATDPKVLLCDEATSALDPKTTHQILKLIKKINQEMGITCVIITHQMSVVEDICNKVAILDKGVIVEKGPVSEVLVAPASAAGRKLVFPNRGDLKAFDPNHARQLRLVFSGADITGKPLIATLATELKIIASVIAADTKVINGNVVGTMLINVSKEDFDQAWAYISKIEGISLTEVDPNV